VIPEIINDENKVPLTQLPSQRNLEKQDQSEALKRMHKQASINIRHPTVLKSTLRRRGMIIGNTTDPLEQYKPQGMMGFNNPGQVSISSKMQPMMMDGRY
jgi:hypothetical protein